MSNTADILGSLEQPNTLREMPTETIPSGEPIQPPYITRGGREICPDCRRVRCICAWCDPEDD